MKRLIHIQEASNLTGLAVQTLYQMTSSRRIPFTKLGGRVLFDPVKLEEWIEKNSYTVKAEK